MAITRYLLSKKARGTIKDNDSISFAFADINCSLGVELMMALLDTLIVSRSFIILLKIKECFHISVVEIVKIDNCLVVMLK